VQQFLQDEAQRAADVARERLGTTFEPNDQLLLGF
jgi:hypothetical protein